MPAQCKPRLRIPCLAWALLISALVHVLLILLVSQPAGRPAMAANGTFIFHVSMQPAPAATPALQLAPPPAVENAVTTPVQPPPEIAVLEAPAVAAAEKYYEVQELDTPPAPKQQIEPQYPPEALAARMSGMVQLEMYVDESGAVRALRVLRSTAPEVFDQAALDAFREQPFAPGIKDGRPVRTRLKLVVNFGDHPEEGLP